MLASISRLPDAYARADAAVPLHEEAADAARIQASADAIDAAADSLAAEVAHAALVAAQARADQQFADETRAIAQRAVSGMRHLLRRTGVCAADVAIERLIETALRAIPMEVGADDGTLRYAAPSPRVADMIARLADLAQPVERAADQLPADDARGFALDALARKLRGGL